MKYFVMVCMLVIASNCFSQEPRLGPKFDYTELKGKYNIYITAHAPNRYVIYNKNSKYIDQRSVYMSWIDQNTAYRYIHLDNRELLGSYLIIYLAPYVKDVKKKLTVGKEILIHLYADMDGNIIELYLTSPTEIKIPVKAYEEFEKAVLSGPLKLYLEKVSIFKDSEWVTKAYPFGQRFFNNKIDK